MRRLVLYTFLALAPSYIVIHDGAHHPARSTDKPSPVTYVSVTPSAPALPHAYADNFGSDAGFV